MKIVTVHLSLLGKVLVDVDRFVSVRLLCLCVTVAERLFENFEKWGLPVGNGDQKISVNYFLIY